VPLKRYVIQETTENRVTFYFRSPREGNYYITVFAQQVNICGMQTSCFNVAFEHTDSWVWDVEISYSFYLSGI